MKRLHGIIAGAIVLIGVVHLAFTPGVGDGFDTSALWFAGSGLFLVTAGLLNGATARAGGTDAFLTYSAATVDILGVGMAVWAIRAVGGPPAWALLLLFGAAAVLTIVRRTSPPGS